ncbi:MAG: rhodanese-related sulfurtransferase [Pikeienuella sp.]
MGADEITIAGFYRFAPVAEPEGLAARLEAVARASGLRGTLLVAPEGMNGTLAGSGQGIDRLIGAIRAVAGFGDLEWRRSVASEMPFRRLKIRVKREIVTLGQPGVDPRARVGTYVAPADWDAVLADPDTVVIDTRNDYEVAIGRFAGALDPETPSFRDFPAWWAAAAPQLAGKRVAMYCTGGIRCEKASSFLLGAGVPEVRHLRGGILAYLAEIPPAESRWRGECFVFDGRVAVGHGLAPGSHVLCHACGGAVSVEARQSPDWRPGVSCPSCIGNYSAADRARFAERQRQATLARSRGLSHLAQDG